MIKARHQKMYTEKHKQDMDFVSIGYYYIGPFVDMDVAQKAVNTINSLFALQPKRTRTEYEKVTESIFDLRDEFERGELYKKGLGAKYSKCETWREFAYFMIEGEVYRKVEKEIDWRDDIYEWQHTKKIGIYTPLDFVVSDLIESHPDKFLELCRVALRANGEVE